MVQLDLLGVGDSVDVLFYLMAPKQIDKDNGFECTTVNIHRESLYNSAVEINVFPTHQYILWLKM